MLLSWEVLVGNWDLMACGKWISSQRLDEVLCPLARQDPPGACAASNSPVLNWSVMVKNLFNLILKCHK